MSIHESLISEPEEESVTIETTADVIKPVFRTANALVDEIKLHVDEDGIEYTAVDPANVAQISMTVPSQAFDSYDVEKRVLGMGLKRVRKALRAGRQRQSDTINMSVENNLLKSTVNRDYDGVTMDLQNQVRLLDPDSIRAEPEVPNVNIPAEATVPRNAFADAVGAIDEITDHMEIRTEGVDLVLTANGVEDSNSVAIVSDVVENVEDDVTSLFSLDYIKDLLKAMAAFKADELRLEIGEDFPVKIHFSREVNGAEITGFWFQAPRIRSE